jgi:hypothetical protein
MKHYHIRIKGESSRTRGALTLTREAAENERAIEQAGGHAAEIEECNGPCFGERAVRPR